MRPDRRVAELADAASAHACGVEDGITGAAEQLRDALAAELDRAGTTVGLLDAFDLPPALRHARRLRILIEEDRLPFPRDRRLLATALVPVFGATAFWERRMRKLNPPPTSASNAA